MAKIKIKTEPTIKTVLSVKMPVLAGGGGMYVVRVNVALSFDVFSNPIIIRDKTSPGCIVKMSILFLIVTLPE
jgi:hypothetical protein